MLAAALLAAGVPLTTSVAGATDDYLPLGPTRVGGFGGVDGLVAWLRAHPGVVAVVDATHPYAAQMSAHAALACERTGVPLLSVRRPGWAAHPDAGRWQWVDTHAEAAEAALRCRVAAGMGAILLTVGRTATASYLAVLGDVPVVARVAAARDLVVPPAWTLLEARGPFAEDGERALFADHAVCALVTKDSGGAATAAKLDVAEQRSVPVIVVRRPPGQATPEGDPPSGFDPAPLVARVLELAAQRP